MVGGVVRRIRHRIRRDPGRGRRGVLEELNGRSTQWADEEGRRPGATLGDLLNRDRPLGRERVRERAGGAGTAPDRHGHRSGCRFADTVAVDAHQLPLGPAQSRTRNLRRRRCRPAAPQRTRPRTTPRPRSAAQSTSPGRTLAHRRRTKERVDLRRPGRKRPLGRSRSTSVRPRSYAWGIAAGGGCPTARRSGRLVLQVASAGADVPAARHERRYGATPNWRGTALLVPAKGSRVHPPTNPFDPSSTATRERPNHRLHPPNEGFAGVILGDADRRRRGLSLYCIDINTYTYPGTGYGLGTWGEASVPNVGYVARSSTSTTRTPMNPPP